MGKLNIFIIILLLFSCQNVKENNKLKTESDIVLYKLKNDEITNKILNEYKKNRNIFINLDKMIRGEDFIGYYTKSSKIYLKIISKSNRYFDIHKITIHVIFDIYYYNIE
jgi:hypothetical protein